MNAKSIKIVSYNIRKGKGIRGSRPSFEEIARSLAELAPDMLLCQEVFHSHGGASQSAEVAATLDLLHRYEPNAEYRRGHHGNATFSRFPISRHENLDISTNRVERRGILYTRVHPRRNKMLHVFNTHFGLSQKQRRQQARRLGKMTARAVDLGEPLIIGGDFNDWNGRIDPLIMEESGVDNAMLYLALDQRKTWSTRRPLFSLDRIYYQVLHLVDVSVLSSSPWSGLSDHFPIVAHFELPYGS